MKKRPILVIIILSFALSLLTSGCGAKKASYVGKLFGNENINSEEESQEAAEYRSLIAKYVRKSGE